jgi:hypothetical protein
MKTARKNNSSPKELSSRIKSPFALIQSKCSLPVNKQAGFHFSASGRKNAAWFSETRFKNCAKREQEKLAFSYSNKPSINEERCLGDQLKDAVSSQVQELKHAVKNTRKVRYRVQIYSKIDDTLNRCARIAPMHFIDLCDRLSQELVFAKGLPRLPQDFRFFLGTIGKRATQYGKQTASIESKFLWLKNLSKFKKGFHIAF